MIENKRFKYSQTKEKVFKLLKGEVFPRNADIYMFALSLGVKNRKRIPLEDSRPDPIAYTIFDDGHKKFMDLVVLFETQNIDLLNKNDENLKEYIKIIEEYTNGGLEIILKEIEVSPENSYQILLAKLKDELKEDNLDLLEGDLF